MNKMEGTTILSSYRNDGKETLLQTYKKWNAMKEEKGNNFCIE